MKQFLAIKGTQERVPNLEVNVDTVYVRSNIERIETEDFTGWQYDEIQYALREYQELLGGKTEMLEVEKEAISEALFEVASLTAMHEEAFFELVNLIIGGNE